MCLCRGIDDPARCDLAFPEELDAIIAADRRLTDGVAAGDVSRAERHRLLSEMIEQLRDRESWRWTAVVSGSPTPADVLATGPAPGTAAARTGRAQQALLEIGNKARVKDDPSLIGRSRTNGRQLNVIPKLRDWRLLGTRLWVGHGDQRPRPGRRKRRMPMRLRRPRRTDLPLDATSDTATDTTAPASSRSPASAPPCSE